MYSINQLIDELCTAFATRRWDVMLLGNNTSGALKHEEATLKLMRQNSPRWIPFQTRGLFKSHLKDFSFFQLIYSTLRCGPVLAVYILFYLTLFILSFLGVRVSKNYLVCYKDAILKNSLFGYRYSRVSYHLRWHKQNDLVTWKREASAMHQMREEICLRWKSVQPP